MNGLAEKPQLHKHNVLLRFFKRFTFLNLVGISIAIIAWAGDSFLGWQDNIGYYLMGMFASWFMSHKNEA